jgi:hypothetical protein
MPRGRPRQDAATATAAQPAKTSKVNGNGANLGFEAQLFLAADKLRKNLEPSDYKHVALGLIFLKHISNAFEAKRAELLAEDPAAAEGPPADRPSRSGHIRSASSICLFRIKYVMRHMSQNGKCNTVRQYNDEGLRRLVGSAP